MKRLLLFLMCCMLVPYLAWGAKVYGYSVFYGDISIGSWDAVEDIIATVTNKTDGAYSSGAREFRYRVNGTNLLGRLPASTNTIVTWVGSAGSNAVYVTWPRYDGISNIILERSTNAGVDWVWQVLGPRVKAYTDDGSDSWSTNNFTNTLSTIPDPNVPWVTWVTNSITSAQTTRWDSASVASIYATNWISTNTIQSSATNLSYTAMTNFLDVGGYLTAETDPFFITWGSTNIYIQTSTNLSYIAMTNLLDTGGYLTSETDPIHTNWLTTNTYIQVSTNLSYVAMTNLLDTGGYLTNEPAFTNWADTNIYIQTSTNLSYDAMTNFLDAGGYLTTESAFTNFYDTEWLAYTNVARGSTNVIVDGVGGSYNESTRVITVTPTNNLLRSGARAWTGNANYGGFKGTNMLAGTDPLDGVNKTQLDGATNAVDANSWHINGDNSPTGPMNGGGQALTNVAYMTLVSTNPSGNSIEAAGGIVWATDGGGDIGASGANRPNNLYVKTSIMAGEDIRAADDLFANGGHCGVSGTAPKVSLNPSGWRNYTIMAFNDDLMISVLDGANRNRYVITGDGDQAHTFYGTNGTTVFASLSINGLALHTNKITFQEAGTDPLDGVNKAQLDSSTNAIDNAWLSAMFTDAYLVDGSRTQTGDHVYSGSRLIKSDALNNAIGIIGGTASTTGNRGGAVYVYGPDNASSVDLLAEGDGAVIIRTGDRTMERMKIASNGVVTVSESLEVGKSLTFTEMAEPSDPADGKCIIWFSSGSGAGNDGDLMLKKTVAGVVSTNTVDITGL